MDDRDNERDNLDPQQQQPTEGAESHAAPPARDAAPPPPPVERPTTRMRPPGATQSPQPPPGMAPPPPQRPAGPPPGYPPPGVYPQAPYQQGPYPQGPAPWGQPPGGYPPPGGFQPAPRGRNRALPLIIGLIVLFVVVGFGLITLVAGIGASASTTTTSGSPFAMFGSRIAVLNIEGVLGEGPGYAADTAKLVEQVKSWTENTSIRAMVLRINSPGGAVSATQDLVDAINEFRSTERPVFASMGDIAASGGYYAATAADVVYANEGTLTGSIGVIMSFYNYEGLQDKIGLSSVTIKSGEFKDIGSGTRPMTEAEKELLGDMIGDVYGQFLDEVVAARSSAVKAKLGNKATDDAIRDHIATYADGRIFSGRQAVEYGLVDTLGTLEDAIAAAATKAGLKDYTVVRGPVRPVGLFGAIGAVSNKAIAVSRDEVGMVKLEYRFGL